MNEIIKATGPARNCNRCGQFTSRYAIHLLKIQGWTEYYEPKNFTLLCEKCNKANQEQKVSRVADTKGSE